MWNLPNILTLLRLVLIPVYWVFMMVKDNETAALIVFISASVTDLLDGYIARKHNQVTDWGKLFDPVADKLMVISVLLSLLLKGLIPFAIILIVFIKEVIMMAGAAFMLRHKVVVYSKPIGKTAQFITIIGMILTFFRESFKSPIHIYVLWVGVGLMLIALIYYSLGCLRALRNKTNNLPTF
ncbi:MAG: CDP-alcohol phosphatidyltransferase family protein [Clostridiales bacterium]|nr:CDP-alcohol phosphatidyltransferase family protein [Clostridiales bacterium]